ncbi:MAG TPA: hypothetical protein VK980_13680 [Sphingomonas sp.]|nr:hypothetical protein [Sphingomonas sp.]
MAHFSLNFVEDDYGEASLIATLDTGEFKGQCRYWCPPREFDDLLVALRTFPITMERPLDMLWYDDCIELRIEPLDSVGHLRVSAALRDFRSDWNRCQSQFHTTYGGLDRMREQLQKVLATGLGEAILSSS